jgi:hypothetical protein
VGNIMVFGAVADLVLELDGRVGVIVQKNSTAILQIGHVDLT